MAGLPTSVVLVFMLSYGVVTNHHSLRRPSPRQMIQPSSTTNHLSSEESTVIYDEDFSPPHRQFNLPDMTYIVRHDTMPEEMGRENKSSTVRRCTSRSKAVRCPVMVRQEGDTFVQIHEHVHPGVPDRDTKMNVYAKVKQAVLEPALTIAESVLLGHERPGVPRPKKALLKRAVNRARAQLRPQEPRTLDFEIDGELIDAETFLVDDIKMPGGQRHFVFATPYQLQLLKHARRWYIDGTFKTASRLETSKDAITLLPAYNKQ